MIRPPIRRLFLGSGRLLVTGAAALAGLSLAATACDSSPVAATVNGQVIKQSALNHELADWSGDRAYVSAFDQANSSNTLTNGGTISVAGQGTGTYNNVWVSSILNNIIAAAAVHQHLASTSALPDAATLSATRSLLEFAEPGWYSLPASFRQTLTQRFAEEAAIRAADPPGSAPPVDPATISQAYKQYQPYFFSSVCVLQAESPTENDAQVEAAAGLPNTEPQTCFDQAQFEDQPTSFRSAVLTTPAGKVAPVVPTAYGFEVVQVVSRTEQGYSAQVQNVLSTVLANQTASDPGITNLINQAHVHLNPAYGTWKAPNVTPPSIPNLRT